MLYNILNAEESPTQELSLEHSGSCLRDGTRQIIRTIDSLQLTAVQSLATPANWEKGDRCMVLPNISPEDATAKFPQVRLSVQPARRLVAKTDEFIMYVLCSCRSLRGLPSTANRVIEEAVVSPWVTKLDAFKVDTGTYRRHLMLFMSILLKYSRDTILSSDWHRPMYPTPLVVIYHYIRVLYPRRRLLFPLCGIIGY